MRRMSTISNMTMRWRRVDWMGKLEEDEEEEEEEEEEDMGECHRQLPSFTIDKRAAWEG